MAFTTATVRTIEQGNKQFQGAFTDMWAIVLNVDPASVAAGAEDTGVFTIPNITVGDMVLGVAAGVNLTIDADIAAHVSAPGQLTVRLSNLNATTALDLALSQWRVLIGRPIW